MRADDIHFHLPGGGKSPGDDQNGVDSSEEAAEADADDDTEGRPCLAHRSAGTLLWRPSLYHGRHCQRLHPAPRLRFRPASWSSYHDCSSRHRDYARTYARSMPPRLPRYRRASVEWRGADNHHMGKDEDDAMGAVDVWWLMPWIRARFHCPIWRVSSSFLDWNAKPWQPPQRPLQPRMVLEWAMEDGPLPAADRARLNELIDDCAWESSDREGLPGGWTLVPWAIATE